MKTLTPEVKRNLVIHVVLPVGMTVVLFACAFLFIALPTMEESLMNSKRDTIRELTDSVWTLIAEYRRREQNGELSREEAQTRVLKRLEKMRYGPEGKDYYWVNDMRPYMIMHPYRTDLNGTDLSNFKDPEGKHLFVEFVETVKRQGSGYVSYSWQWKDERENIVPKMSYVRGFEPWGWIVGTGMYVEDVKATISELTKRVWTAFAAIFLVAMGLSVYVIRQGITAEKQNAAADKALVESERRQAAIIDFLPDATFVVDDNLTIIAWNKAMELLTNTPSSEMLGKSQSETARVFYDAPRQLLIDYIFDPDKASGEGYRRFEREGDKFIGEVFSPAIGDHGRYLYAVASPLYGKDKKVVGAIESIRDITDKMRLEETLIQSEKMLSVGGLAAGMAHEINNPLAGMLQSTQVILNRLSKDLLKNETVAEKCGTNMDAITEYAESREINNLLNNIMLSGQRAAKIVDNMLSFARKSSTSFSTEDLVELVENTIDLASNDYNLKKKYDFRKIKIVRDYKSKRVLVPCEGSKIQQVMLNLLKNAAQAMSDAKIGDPTIEVTIEDKGLNAVVKVSDNGPGIDENARKRIFEPFYTTKEVGMGTGLGLSVSYFIVTENHDGEMQVESIPNERTTFTFALPKGRSSKPPKQ